MRQVLSADSVCKDGGEKDQVGGLALCGLGRAGAVLSLRIRRCRRVPNFISISSSLLDFFYRESQNCWGSLGL